MRGLLRLLTLSAVGTLCSVGAAHAAAPTVVTFGFDDGTADQLAAAQLLKSHGMNATFFVNSGKIETPGFLTWNNLATLQTDGNEIGGHTTNHVDLLTATEEQRKTEVCGDLATLKSHSLAITSFAYPYGSYRAANDQTNPNAVEAVVKGCNGGNGYTSARTTEGIDPSDCDLCAEPLPVASNRFFRTRALQLRSDNTAQQITDAIAKAQADSQAQARGGWFQLVLHNVCENNCGGDYTTTPAVLDAVLTWLAAQPADKCYLVKTVQQVTSSAPLTCPAGPTDPGGSGGGGGTGGTGGTGGSGGGTPSGGGTTPTTTTTTTPVAPVVVDAPPADPPAAAVVLTRTPAAAASRSGLPTVTLLAPARGRAVHGIVTLRARVTPSTGVKRVEFLVNGKVVATRTTAPYTVRWNTSSVRPGRVVLSVRVTDAQGTVVRGASRSLRVTATAHRSGRR